MLSRSVLPALCLIGMTAPLSANELSHINAFACGVVDDPAVTGTTVQSPLPISLPSYQPDAASTVKLRIMYPASNGNVEVDHCGGTAIDENWIVTAGHCVAAETGWSHIEVIAGDQHLDGPNTIRRVATDAVCHAGFRYETLENDIALLRVDHPLPKRITPMGMDSQGHYSVGGGDIAVARGWPVTGSRSGDRMLNQTKMRVRSVDPASYITATTVSGAAGGLCRGESGGPLVMSTPAGRMLTGILSGIQPGTINPYGEECLVPGYEMYFTPIASYRNWIETARSTCNRNPEACRIRAGGNYAFAQAQPLPQSQPAYEMPAQQIAYAQQPLTTQPYYADPQIVYNSYHPTPAQQGWAQPTVQTFVTYAQPVQTYPYPVHTQDHYNVYSVASAPSYGTVSYATTGYGTHSQATPAPQYETVGNYDSYHSRGGLIFLPGSARTRERVSHIH